jgi:hypothetical protein
MYLYQIALTMKSGWPQIYFCYSKVFPDNVSLYDFVTETLLVI